MEEKVLEPNFLRYQGHTWLFINICANLTVPNIEWRLNLVSNITVLKKAGDG